MVYLDCKAHFIVKQGKRKIKNAQNKKHTKERKESDNAFLSSHRYIQFKAPCRDGAWHIRSSFLCAEWVDQLIAIFLGSGALAGSTLGRFSVSVPFSNAAVMPSWAMPSKLNLRVKLPTRRSL